MTPPKVGWRTTSIQRVHQEPWLMLVRVFAVCPVHAICSIHAEDDDYAAYVLADVLQKPASIKAFLYERAMRTPFTLFNDQTGFMEARNKDGSWAGDNRGWTEGPLIFY